MEKKKVMEVSASIGLILIISVFAVIFLIRNVDESPTEPAIEPEPNFKKLLTDTVNEVLEDVELISCVAVSSNNISVCGEAPDKEMCNNIYFFYRSTLYNENLCNQISDWRKQTCLVTKEKAISQCESIPSENGKELCKKTIKLSDAINSDTCSTLEFDQYTLCKALKANDARACILAWFYAQERLTNEICNTEFDNLPPPSKSFCKKYRSSKQIE